MSLSIMYDANTGRETWVPLSRPAWEEILKVQFIQADGHELDEILSRFPYLEKKLSAKNSRIATFVGDEARYILFNLGYK